MFGISQPVDPCSDYLMLGCLLGANNESSEVCGYLLPVTYLINPSTRLDNATNFWRFVIGLLGLKNHNWLTGGGNQNAIMSISTVISLLAMKQKLYVSSFKSVKHDGNLIIAGG